MTDDIHVTATPRIIGREFIEKKRRENAQQSEAGLHVAFASWRFHVWMNNHGSYNTIHRKIKKGVLTPFVCPDPNCDCEWRKPRPGGEK